MTGLGNVLLIKIFMNRVITIKSRYNWSLILFITILFIHLSACSERTSESVESPKDGFIRVKDQMFVDYLGRQVILNGINLINKNQMDNYVCALTPETFSKVRQFGFNVIRLGIIWDGLEPEAGVYNEDMFKCLDERIQWAKENDLYVIIDMHQDLFSVKYSDGAPVWATLDEGKPHHTGEVWSDSYLISPAVQTAFDNFWENTPVEDSIGVQDHYANLWKYIAERYADETTVVGYDIMNEPFPGSLANEIMLTMVQAYGQWLAEETGQKLPEAEKLFAMWNSIEGRHNVLKTMEDTTVYKRVLLSTTDIIHDFEKGQLMAMYEKVGQAIREVDTNHILFIEHSYFCNPGVPSGIQPLKDAEGKIDRKVAYTPHGYDLLVDTEAYKEASTARVEYLFKTAKKTADRLNMPMLVGEWGAWGSNEGAYVHQADKIMRLFESQQSSQTYWAYYNNIEKNSFFKVLTKPYPTAVAGEIIKYSYDWENEIFTCEWEENSSMDVPSLFYLPDVSQLEEENINLNPGGYGFEIKTLDIGASARLNIQPLKENIIRKLTIQF